MGSTYARGSGTRPFSLKKEKKRNPEQRSQWMLCHWLIRQINASLTGSFPLATVAQTANQ
jgi:hypothetical protein